MRKRSNALNKTTKKITIKKAFFKNKLEIQPLYYMKSIAIKSTFEN
jgi:hypothetical protein